MLEYTSPAKVNLVLEVLGKRPDGYHELKSIVQTIDLCDTLYFELAEEVSFQCTEPALNTSQNLVVRAANLLKQTTGYGGGAKVLLEKRIPWGAGLGGGSSNAAITLIALNRLWGLNLSHSELAGLATRLGSDVPFFIYGSTALVEGRGEKVTPLDALPTIWLVLLIPPFTGMPDKTRRLFSLLKPEHYTSGEFVSKALESQRKQGGIAPSLMFNTFDKIAFETFPSLEYYWNAFQEVGATYIHLVGSGPCLFSAADNRSHAEAIATSLTKKGLKAFVTSTKPARRDP